MRNVVDGGGEGRENKMERESSLFEPGVGIGGTERGSWAGLYTVARWRGRAIYVYIMMGSGGWSCGVYR